MLGVFGFILSVDHMQVLTYFQRQRKVLASRHAAPRDIIDTGCLIPKSFRCMHRTTKERRIRNDERLGRSPKSAGRDMKRVLRGSGRGEQPTDANTHVLH
jgi:hypothetical protein